MPKFVNRYITERLVYLGIRPILLVGMGKCILSRKNVIVRSVSSVFYNTAEGKIDIAVVRILKGCFEFIPYAQYIHKSKIRYIKNIYYNKAKYYSGLLHNRVGCPEMAGVFLL